VRRDEAGVIDQNESGRMHEINTRVGNMSRGVGGRKES